MTTTTVTITATTEPQASSEQRSVVAKVRTLMRRARLLQWRLEGARGHWHDAQELEALRWCLGGIASRFPSAANMARRDLERHEAQARRAFERTRKAGAK